MLHDDARGVVRESLLSRAGRRGLAVHERPLRERLKDLAREVDALPERVPADRTSPDQPDNCSRQSN
jgi:hypothetical protein